MAKSLRASTHIKAKSVKRKAVFQHVVNAREQRLSEKLKNDLIKQKLEDLKKNEGIEMDAASLIKQEEEKAKAKAQEPEKTVSTSGWREASHHNYKKAQIRKNKKKNKFTRF
ncbi:hypothetical protein TPHA_0M01340 [Tetrapisispora phaffii CBS 4417]|uniref:DUF2423 domain-containing protein n=1 Tax=Tetrapisispora phaffii (strain ATCC 24235 / CBS 4417 / NBRC 1672 / NRRL Y-8282 / UCD 70-5) TaxID=1071381 RepID=G8C0J4_TETPH|nr:hypothetical protein TPHA_0M01340 [Tetrapisispora phaffii CBS 4417]CCE65709.1 hypothetical protein TPHA_0M01340 [Tetrapisispora phaffii CBS 4417]